MINLIKNLKFLYPLVPNFIINKLKKTRDKREWEEWKKNGYPIPTPHVAKQITIEQYQKKYQYSILVETGTFFGDMIEAQKKNFKRIISIELGEELFKKAKKRFKKDKNVLIVHGDSSKMLSLVMEKINEPAIFWLDGHYSMGETAKGDTECPIFPELDAIFIKQLNHILLIDDARCFNGTGDYPAVDVITAYLKNKNINFEMELRDDIIRYIVIDYNLR